MIIETALMCLALNVYHEARGEPIPGQYAVALVTVNRAAQQDNKVCTEVFRRYQFSWTGGVQKSAAGWRISHHMLPREKTAWEKAQTIAKVTLEKQMHDITNGATFYHASYVSPSWRHSMVKTKRIGTHFFYAKPE